MKVSVIINCYNGEEFLQETLSCLKSQTFQDFEIVFLDNCSTDNSSKIALEYGSKLSYYKTDKHISLGEARNEAIKKAKGDYIAFLDCDDLWEQNKLELQVKALDNNPDCGMVFSNYKILNMLSNTIEVFDKDAVYNKVNFNDFVCKYQISLSSFLIRKESLSDLDHFFNNDFNYAEEFELFSRIAFYRPSIYLAEPLATYRIHKEMNTRKLIDIIGKELGIILEMFHNIDTNFAVNYPDVEKYLSFKRDFAITKSLLKKGENKNARRLMRNYFSNKKAFCFYLFSFLPKSISMALFNWHYRNQF